MKIEELEKLIESLKEISKYTDLDIEIQINPKKHTISNLNSNKDKYDFDILNNPQQYQPLTIPVTWEKVNNHIYPSDTYYWVKENISTSYEN